MRAEFDDSLVTGNEMIDSQHRELIDKINKLLDSCETSKDKVVAVKTLDYLADYTESVSYTHLDVYKRQVTGWLSLTEISRQNQWEKTRS